MYIKETDCRIDGVSSGHRRHWLRAVHLPTGIMVEIQAQWHDIKNRDYIYRMLDEVVIRKALSFWEV